MTIEAKDRIMQEYANEMNSVSDDLAERMLMRLEAYVDGMRDAKRMYNEKGIQATA